jgi:hypothetical protein
MEQLMEFAGYVFRTEIGKSMAKTAAKSGGRGLTELADHLNHLTAVVDTTRMGVSRTQRLVEGTSLYAPRMRRAGFALITDILQGGLRGREALKALGSTVLGSTALFSALALATGQGDRLDPNHPTSVLNPQSAGYLNIRVGDAWIGVGGMVRQMLRLAGQVATGIQKT